MTTIKQSIEKCNLMGEKALAVFLTGGYPVKEKFEELALSVLDAGADMLEIGFPFSDPLAEGPVIQHSSYEALKNGVNIGTVLKYTEKIRTRSDKPVILMGYANPLLKYGVSEFFRDADNAGVSGVIIPDIPAEEYDSFFGAHKTQTDILLLTAPSSTEEKIKAIDEKSRGFVYCVSVCGTTGERNKFDDEVLDSVRRTYSIIDKNKMMIGFGISGSESIKRVSPYCDGVIVGSAVINQLMSDKDNGYRKTIKFVSSLKDACRS